MQLPGEAAYRAERSAFVATVAGLEPAVFEDGPTLCAAWAPRDVLAHLLGIDAAPLTYLRTGGVVRSANARVVEAFRRFDRETLLTRARRWAEAPAAHVRAAAVFLLGDVAMHHQDVLRPAGRDYPVPAASARAILREGVVLGPHRLARVRVEPTDGLAPALGLRRQRPVRGSTVALGLWLAGRPGLEAELEFG